MSSFLRFDLIIVFAARAVFGLPLSFVFSIVGWTTIRITFPQAGFMSFLYPLIPVLVIGGFAALGAILAWWNTESHGQVKAISSSLVIGSALVTCWIVFQIAINSQETVWVPRIGLAPYIRSWDFLRPTILNVAIISNVVAGGVYIFRVIAYREL